MNALVALKTELKGNGTVAEFEVVSAGVASASTTKDKIEIVKSLNRIESRLAKNQRTIDSINKDIARLTNHADGWDYMVAVLSGVIAGIIDIFFVGEFSLDDGSQWGKEKVDTFVKKVAQSQGYQGSSLEGAVRFLEQKFPIPADSATNIFGGGLQHHLRDFSHHPTPIGLVFSLLTQFTEKVFGTNTAGVFIIEDVPNKALIGNSLYSKLSLGIVSWVFHMVSDIAGSSGSIARGKYGTGLPGPLVSILKELSSLPIFKSEDSVNNFSLFASKLFNGTFLSPRDQDNKLIPEGLIKFDFRAELGILHELGKQATPVIINKVIVRTFYFIRRLYGELKAKKIKSFKDFIHKIDWDNTLPFKNRTTERMMTIACATLTAIDLTDASIRAGLKSGGNPAIFLSNLLLRINFVGIGRLAIAIGTDCYMGYENESLRNKRMQLMNEQIMLGSSKVYYKQAEMWNSISDMWEVAENTEDAIRKMRSTVKNATKRIQNFYIEIGKTSERINLIDTDRIEKKNPGLNKELLEAVYYG